MIATHNPSALPPILLFPEGIAMCSDFVKKSVRGKQSPETVYSPATATESAHTVRVSPVNRLPLEWILNPRKGLSLSERVLARLIQAEAHEAEASFRTDIRIAWNIVLHCMKGDAVECSPAVLAWYQVVGCHPDQFYDKLMIRRAAMFGTEVNRVILPKKSAEKTPSKERKRA